MKSLLTLWFTAICIRSVGVSRTLEIPKIWLTLEIQSPSSIKYIISCELGHKIIVRYLYAHECLCDKNEEFLN